MLSAYFIFHSMTEVHFGQQLVTTIFWMSLVLGSVLYLSAAFHAVLF